MTSFDNFPGHKLSPVDSFKKNRRFKFSRVISFQDTKIKKKKINFLYSRVIYFLLLFIKCLKL